MGLLQLLTKKLSALAVPNGFNDHYEAVVPQILNKMVKLPDQNHIINFTSKLEKKKDF